MEKVASKAEIVADYTLEEVITANEMLDFMAVSGSGDAPGPANDPEVESLLRGLK